LQPIAAAMRPAAWSIWTISAGGVFMTKRARFGALSVAWLGWIAPGQAEGAGPSRPIESGNILCVLRAMKDLPKALDGFHAVADTNRDGRVSKQEGLATAYFIAGGFFFSADKDGDLTVTPREAQEARRSGLVQHPVIRLMLLNPYGAQEPRPWGTLIKLAGMDNREPVTAADVRDSLQTGLDALFWRVDTSRDGFITREESRAAFAELVRAAGRSAYEQIDQDQDGMLSQEEVEADVVASARLGFVMADQNGDGMLTKQEAAVAAKRLAETASSCVFPRAPAEPARAEGNPPNANGGSFHPPGKAASSTP
jgi:Ca2+-binding EF-hand superfamily protein